MNYIYSVSAPASTRMERDWSNGTTTRKSGREGYPCHFPGCTTPKPFKRSADLQRHYQQLHAPPDPSRKFRCDYPRCTRATDPLGRKDHYRDHLRDYHGEDMTKRGNDSRGNGESFRTGFVEISRKEGGVGGGVSGGRGGTGRKYNVSEKWWRCSRCLERKLVSEGWYCGRCKLQCEQERITNRTRMSKRYHIYDHEEDSNATSAVVKFESFSGTGSGSVSSSFDQSTPAGYQFSSSPGSSSSGNCIYQCNNTWICSPTMTSWDPCPNCQGPSPSTTTTNYNHDPEPSSSSQDILIGNTDTYPPLFYSSTTVPDIYSTSLPMESPLLGSFPPYWNIEENDITTSSILDETGTGVLSDCGACNNYLVWDGIEWVDFSACMMTTMTEGAMSQWPGATETQDGGSGSTRVGRRMGRRRVSSSTMV